MYFNRKNKGSIRTLERRLAHLEKRVKEYDGDDNHHDRAEAGALKWALKVVKEQEESEVLHHV